MFILKNNIFCYNLKLINKYKIIQSSKLRSIFPSRRWQLCETSESWQPSQEKQEEHPRNGQSRNTSVPRINEEYISQVSEEIEGRVTKNLSSEFSRTELRILGALCELDEFLLNPQVRTHSGSVPGKFQNRNVENQKTNEGDSQSYPHPETGIFCNQTTQNFGPEVGNGMVTGVQEEIRYRTHMVTGIQEEISYSSLGTSSGKQKKTRSTSHPKQKKARCTSHPYFPSENTPATIEANQILMAFQQLASNSKSANVINNINKISKLPKCLTTTMPIFDGKTAKIELFENLFQTSLEIQNQLTEEDNINYIHSLMRADALQKFKNTSS